MMRAEEGADRRAVAAGQQAAADHGGDDRLEFLLEAAPRIGRAGIEHREDGDERRGAGGQHEQAGLHPVDRHAGIARRIGIAAGGEDPVADPRAQQHPGGDAAKPMNQTMETGTPVTFGAPLGNFAMRSCVGEPGEQALEGDAGEEFAHEPSPAPSPMPRSWVEPPVAHFSPTSDRPRRMNRKASVTMKDGSRVRMTIWPLMAPSTPATRRSSRMASQSGRPDESPEARRR